MFTMLRQRRWLGHVHRMEDGKIPKDLLYSELATGTRNRGRSQLRYKDVIMRYMRACRIQPGLWEAIASNRPLWKKQIATGLEECELALRQQNDRKRVRRKASHSQNETTG